MLPSLNGIKDCIWSLNTAPKIIIFLWKVISGAFPVADNLTDRGMKIDTRCQICGLEGESLNHVLFSCTIARQTWANSCFSHPPNGFDSSSVYSNIFYVLNTRNNLLIPEHIRRSGPWIIWSIWKNRNSFLFEGKISLGSTFIKAIFEEVDHWFFIKDDDLQAKAIDLAKKKRITFGWKPPPKSWLKCDIASAWDKDKLQSGASWILRNSDEKVVMNGRRSFVGINSKIEASFESWSWALESMKNLHFNAIIFASDDQDLISAVSKPSAWSSLKFYSFHLLSWLQHIVDWKVHFHSHQHIIGAKFIARSVIKEELFQFYISVGFLSWLSHLFV